MLTSWSAHKHLSFLGSGLACPWGQVMRLSLLADGPFTYLDPLLLLFLPSEMEESRNSSILKLGNERRRSIGGSWQIGVGIRGRRDWASEQMSPDPHLIYGLTSRKHKQCIHGKGGSVRMFGSMLFGTGYAPLKALHSVTIYISKTWMQILCCSPSQKHDSFICQ